MAGRYRDFAQLRRQETEGRDYTVMHRDGRSGVLVMAPHGGGIEAGTGDLAEALAGDDHALYCFRGIKKEGNRGLHIPSNRFDDPLAIQMLLKSRWVLTLHGCRDEAPVVWVGGRDYRRGGRMIDGLREAQIPAGRCHRPHLRGLHPLNICNRGLYRAGVQLEISLGLRKMMFINLDQHPLRRRTPLFRHFTHTLARCLPAAGISMDNRTGCPAIYPIGEKPDATNQNRRFR